MTASNLRAAIRRELAVGEWQPKILEFVRSSDQPVYIRTVMEGLSPIGEKRPDRIWQMEKQDQIRSMVWSMIDSEGAPATLRLANDLTLHVLENDDDN